MRYRDDERQQVTLHESDLTSVEQRRWIEEESMREKGTLPEGAGSFYG